jgi:hypothetical protein
MTESQLVEQKQDIKVFKELFLNRYGIKVHIFLPNAPQDKIALDTVHLCTLAALYSEYPEFSHIVSLLERVRKREFMIYAQTFSYVCHLIGYSKTRIGIYLGRTHATIINSCRRVENGLETNDKLTLDTFNKLVNEIENYVGNVPENIKCKTDTKPAPDTIWDQARRLLAIHN